MGTERTDFFVSHAGRDRAWAEWVAWQLTDAGYSVELDVWDWAAGRNFVTAMNGGLARADQVIVLFSRAYFELERYTAEEWSAALVHVPGVAPERLVPVRVEEVPAELVPPLLRTLVYRDVFGLAEEAARSVLLEAVKGPVHPDAAPAFPGRGAPGAVSRLGGSGPRLPGSLPRVWNVPARNPGFAGRDALLVRIREQLLSGDRAVVQALQGMGGVGKTQLAAEYAYRFAGNYDIGWWVAAEQPQLIGEQLAKLAVELHVARPDTEVSLAVQAAKAELRGRDRWLLMFDNAGDPEDVAELLPGGTAGHVLITSRASGWSVIAAPVPLDVFAPSESIAVLRAQVQNLSDHDARRIADKLGNFPLAVAQAASYLNSTGTGTDEYLTLLETRTAEILNEPPPSLYPRPLAAVPLAAVVRQAVDRLAADDVAAVELVRLCAFLAPEPDPAPPAAWFAAAGGQLSPVLRARANNPVAFNRLPQLISRRGLARVEPGGLRLHRLTQAILRDQLSPQERDDTRARAGAVLTTKANYPGDASIPANWAAWARMLPHLLAADPATSPDPEMRRLACWANLYLLKRGDIRGAHDLAAQLHEQWRERHGQDDFYTLWAASNLALALREMGRYAEARQLDEDILVRNRRLHGDDDPETTLHTLGSLAADLRELGEVQRARAFDEDAFNRRRRLLGEDHPDTLGSANGLALDLRQLGEIQTARDLDRDTLDRRRRQLGYDHPDTLTSASNLAADLRELGEVQAARDLNKDTLDRRRQRLGYDHPDTLASAINLAADLHELGDVQAARDLDKDTLDRRRRQLGYDHPDTLTSASNLAADLRALGEDQAARDLDEDTTARRRRVAGDDTHP